MGTDNKSLEDLVGLFKTLGDMALEFYPLSATEFEEDKLGKYSRGTLDLCREINRAIRQEFPIPTDLKGNDKNAPPAKFHLDRPDLLPQEKSMLLAGSMIEHDYIMQWMSESRMRYDSIKKILDPDKLLASRQKLTELLQMAKPYLLAMAYLVTGDKAYDIPFPSDELPLHLKSLDREQAIRRKERFQFVIDLEGYVNDFISHSINYPANIHMPELVCLMQIYKNAIGPNAIVHLGESGIITVCDNGGGISQSDIGSIFKGNSTTGGGLGLRIVNELSRLSEIEIGVINKPYDPLKVIAPEARYFNMRKNTVVPVPVDITIFDKLRHLPKYGEGGWVVFYIGGRGN